MLKPGGFFLFNVWDHLDSNELAATVTATLAGAFPDDPPRFMARTPHGYHDLQQLRTCLAAGGFQHEADIVTLPLRGEIEARAPGRLAEVTALVARAFADRFGAGDIDTRIQAHVVIVGR